MIVSITAACLTALAEVVSAMTIGTAVGGIVANRADSLFCKLMTKTTDHFLKNARLPKNHDLLLGVMDAHQRSISYVAETIVGQARDLRERIIADKLLVAAKQEIAIAGRADLSNSLMPLLTPLIAGPGEGAAEMRANQMITVARDNLITWFEAEIGETIPEHFRRLFAETAPDGRAPWQDVFRLYLSEAIKANPRFKRIFLASNVSEIVGRTVTIETLVIGLGKGLEALRTQLGIVSADVKQGLVMLEVHGHKLDRLLERFTVSPLAAEAPRVKGRALLEWTSARSGLPRPNFRLELQNNMDREVKLSEVVFHLKSATGEESDVPDEFAEKLLVLPSGQSLERQIPSLKILDVVSVEAHSPTKAWGIDWDPRYTRRCAAFKSIKTAFFFNERDRDEMVLDAFQAGEAFYVRKAGYSPSIYDYGFVEKHESEAAALKQFENKRLKETEYLEADDSKFCKISGAQNYFRDYW